MMDNTPLLRVECLFKPGILTKEVIEYDLSIYF
jgi:hypothetical protein